jgi:hypothetical protein
MIGHPPNRGWQRDQLLVFQPPEQESTDLILEGAIFLSPVPEQAQLLRDGGSTLTPKLLDNTLDLSKNVRGDALAPDNQFVVHPSPPWFGEKENSFWL